MRPLTRRQREMLLLVSEGASYAAAAAAMGISRNTALHHAQALLIHYGAQTMVHAVATAFRRGDIK